MRSLKFSAMPERKKWKSGRAKSAESDSRLHEPFSIILSKKDGTAIFRKSVWRAPENGDEKSPGNSVRFEGSCFGVNLFLFQLRDKKAKRPLRWCRRTTVTAERPLESQFASLTAKKIPLGEPGGSEESTYSCANLD
jgi:hypothetical protein